MIGTSTWVKETNVQKYPRLDTDIESDVVIIGAGITGLMCAYLLSKQGKKAVVIEKGKIGDGATQVTTAFLTQVLDTDFSDLISIWGEEKAKRIIQSHSEAISCIEGIINEEKINCNFTRCHDYIYTNSSEQFESLTQEYAAARKIGIDTHLHPIALPGFKNFGYLEIENQAKFEPLAFITSLAKKTVEHGTQIFNDTEVTSIEESSHSSHVEILTKNCNRIKAEWIISATYEPLNQPAGLFLKKGMYTSYVAEALIPKDVIKEGTYEDTENPYHYFRIDRGEQHDRMIIGGEDHRSDVHINPEKNLTALKDYMKKTFDFDYTILNVWDGPVLEPSDGLAFIGPHKNPKVLYAFGFSGNGMTYSAIAGMILRDHILAKANEFRDLYRTDRFLSPKSLLYKGRDFSQEFAHGAIKNALKYSD